MRNVDKKEVDFLVTIDKKPWFAEVEDAKKRLADLEKTGLSNEPQGMSIHPHVR